MPLCMQAFKEHPDKPSQARCEELADAWHDAYTPEAPDRYCPLFTLSEVGLPTCKSI